LNEGEALIQDHQTLCGVYATSHWRPGEVVRDFYALGLPEDQEPEAVQVVVLRTNGAEFENIAVISFSFR
jgi:hypothetical protein